MKARNLIRINDGVSGFHEDKKLNVPGGRRCGRFNVAIKPDNLDKCITVLTQHSMELVRASDLYRI